MSMTSLKSESSLSETKAWSSTPRCHCLSFPLSVQLPLADLVLKKYQKLKCTKSVFILQKEL